MKDSYIRLTLILAVFATAFSMSNLRADGHGHTKMEDSMDKLNDAFRELRKAVRRPDPAQKETYLGYIDVILKEAKISKEYVHMRYEGMEGEELETAMASFEKDMDIFIKTIEELYAAIDAEDFDAANEKINMMRRQKSSGHQAHKPEDE